MASEGQVIACHKLEEWEENFKKAKESGALVVVDFTASWCGPCRAIAPIFTELAKTHPHVVFLKVDVDELQSVSKEYKIEAMPTFVFLRGGEVVHTIVGADKNELAKKVKELAPTVAAVAAATASAASVSV